MFFKKKKKESLGETQVSHQSWDRVSLMKLWYTSPHIKLEKTLYFAVSTALDPNWLIIQSTDRMDCVSHSNAHTEYVTIDQFRTDITLNAFISKEVPMIKSIHVWYNHKWWDLPLDELKDPDYIAWI